MYFAGPACFSCSAVWPSFEKLVRALHEKNPNIVFAFVDLTHNELQDEAKIFAFPTLRLYPANTNRSSTWLGFSQDPTYELLLKFLQQNAKGGEIAQDMDQLQEAIEDENKLNAILAGEKIDDITEDQKQDDSKINENSVSGNQHEEL